MLRKMKGLGEQLTTKASETVGNLAASVRNNVGSLGDAASAGAVALNDKAIRSAVAHMRSMLSLAENELREHPLGNSDVTLTASVTVGLAALQMQVVVTPTASTAPARPRSRKRPTVNENALDTVEGVLNWSE